MNIITTTGYKGGTGKTTLALLIAKALAASKKRILFIDCDQQLYATTTIIPQYMGNNGLVEQHNIKKAFEEESLQSNIIKSHMEYIHIVPSHMEVENFMQQHTNVGLFKELVEKLPADTYDTIVIDNHPSVNPLVRMTWHAATHIITPARVDSYDMMSLAALRRMILKEVGTVDHWKIIINFAKNNFIINQYSEVFKDSYDNVITTSLPDSSIIAQNIHAGKAITQSLKNQNIYKSIIEITEEITQEKIHTEGRKIA